MPVVHSKFTVRCALLLAPVLLAGCTVGPNYHPPQATLPSSWPALSSGVKLPDPVNGIGAPQTSVQLHDLAALGKWWMQFKDPLLDKLISDALENNLDLRRAEFRIAQARAGIGIARAGFFPHVAANEQGSRSAQPGGAFFQSFVQHGLNATWELDFFGGTRRSVEASNAQFTSSIEDRRNLMLILIADVGADYIAYRCAQKQIAIARANLASQQNSADITNKRFKGGFVTGLDTANADALIAVTRAEIPALETQAQQLSYRIAVLLGREPNALEEELKAGAPIPPAPPGIPMGLPSDLLRRRPDIRSAEAQVHAANALIGVAQAELLPKFSLTGSAGTQGSRLPALFKAASRVWAVSSAVQWQGFAGGRIGSNIQLQKALKEEAVLAYQQTVLTALQDVDNALVAYVKEKERRQALAEAVEANTKSEDISLKLYGEGKTDFLNVINAQRSLFQAQDALAQSERNMSTDIVALYKALGGGWEEAELDRANRGAACEIIDEAPSADKVTGK